MLGALFNLIDGNDTGNAVMDAADKNRLLLELFGDDGEKLIQLHTKRARDRLTGLSPDLQRFMQMGERGSNLLADALGVNGEIGGDRATKAFRAGPGYEFMMEQGLDALDRLAAARGQLNSGQTNLDTMTFAQGLADQEWDSWLDSLGGYTGQWAGGLDRAGALGRDIGNLDLGKLDSLLGIRSGVTSGIMGTNNQWASGKEAHEAANDQMLSGLGSGIESLAGNIAGGGFGGFGGGMGGSWAAANAGFGGGGGFGNFLKGYL